jgi:hypothetical protein
MMRFRCPYCQHILEVAKPTHALLCPACEQWCRIPLPEEFTLEREEVRDVVEVVRDTTTSSCPRREAITDRSPEERPQPLRDEADVEDVQFEVIEDGEERRRRRKRRRRSRRRRSSGIGFDLDYISLPLILLIVMAPGGLILSILSFFIHPMAGMGCLLMMGGGIWFMLIAAEDGLVQALLVLFVPFYAWYYAFMNWERVAIPFLLQCVGGLVFSISLGAAGMRAVEDRSSSLPVPQVRVLV